MFQCEGSTQITDVLSSGILLAERFGGTDTNTLKKCYQSQEDYDKSPFAS